MWGVRHTPRLAIILPLLTLLVGCASEGATRQAWVNGQGGLDRGVTQRRVDRAVAPLIDGTAGSRISVRILNSPDVCAYGWKDGDIYLTRGLVALLDDSQIAAAVAHELGHLLQDGHVRSLVSLRGCESGADEEGSADLLGIGLLEARGLSGEAMVGMLTKVAQAPGVSPSCRRDLLRRAAALERRRTPARATPPRRAKTSTASPRPPVAPPAARRSGKPTGPPARSSPC